MEKYVGKREIITYFWISGPEKKGLFLLFFLKRKVHALITFLLFKKDKETTYRAGIE